MAKFTPHEVTFQTYNSLALSDLYNRDFMQQCDIPYHKNARDTMTSKKKKNKRNVRCSRFFHINYLNKLFHVTTNRLSCQNASLYLKT